MQDRSCRLFVSFPRLPSRPALLALAIALGTTDQALAAATTLRSYAVAPGPLGHVLADFAAQAGVPLAFDATLLDAQQSPGLQGSTTVEDGFAQLLAGSGYRLQARTAGGYTLVADSGDAYVLEATTISAAAPVTDDHPRRSIAVARWRAAAAWASSATRTSRTRPSASPATPGS